MIWPKVSISLITYNHEKYIAKCLESVISQQVDFDFEVIVADDFSTDCTPTIILEYAARYPGIIKPLLHHVNNGMVKNALSALAACKGEYIAMMEGDDFWCNPDKLQLQAVYLDKNPDCSICFTNGFIFYEENPGKKEYFFSSAALPPSKFNLDQFLRQNLLIPHNTKMFRKSALPPHLPEFIYRSINWDWVLHVCELQKGNAGYIDEITLAYRRHSTAAFNAQKETDILLSGLATIQGINKYLNYQYNFLFGHPWWEYREISFAYLKSNSFLKFIRYYLQYLLNLRKLSNFKPRDDFAKFYSALFRRS